MHIIEFSQFSQFTILPNHAILNSVGSVDCIVKGITVLFPNKKLFKLRKLCIILQDRKNFYSLFN